jgi:hypothetical protein
MLTHDAHTVHTDTQWRVLHPSWRYGLYLASGYEGVIVHADAPGLSCIFVTMDLAGVRDRAVHAPPGKILRRTSMHRQWYHHRGMGYILQNPCTLFSAALFNTAGLETGVGVTLQRSTLQERRSTHASGASVSTSRTSLSERSGGTTC